VIAVAVLSAMLAAASALVTRPSPRQRLRVLIEPAACGSTSASGSCDGSAESPTAPHGRPGMLRVAAAAGVVLAGVVVVGGVLGAILGGAGGLVVARLRGPAAGPQIAPGDVPVVVDLLAGCLAGGTGMADALDAAAVAGCEGLAVACRSVAGALRAGTPPTQAWQPWLADPWLAPVARTAVRTAATGAAAAEDLRRTSARLRAQRIAEAQHRIRRASVWLVVPVGLCFLPAFVVLAVVPLVVGLLPSLR
jgi:Flp pilus assembly protein TadB